MKLDRLVPGEQAVVRRMDTPKALTSQLKNYGLIPGVRVTCRYRSPCGKVTALEFLDSVLAVRTGELKNIWVEC